jgi:hypothetical protein
MPGTNEARISDEQDPLQAQLGAKRANATRTAIAKNKARALHVVKRGHRFGMFRR